MLRLASEVWQLTAGSVVVGLVLAAGAVGAAGPWDSGQRRAERERAVAESRSGAHHRASVPDEPAPAPSAPGVLPALPAAVTAPAAFGKRLAPLLKDPALGPARSAVVIDLMTARAASLPDGWRPWQTELRYDVKGVPLDYDSTGCAALHRTGSVAALVRGTTQHCKNEACRFE